MIISFCTTKIKPRCILNADRQDTLLAHEACYAAWVVYISDKAVCKQKVEFQRQRTYSFMVASRIRAIAAASPPPARYSKVVAYSRRVCGDLWPAHAPGQSPPRNLHMIAPSEHLEFIYAWSTTCGGSPAVSQSAGTDNLDLFAGSGRNVVHYCCSKTFCPSTSLPRMIS